MTVSPTGRVSWSVPKAEASGGSPPPATERLLPPKAVEEPVTVVVRNSGGTESRHRFVLVVPEATAPAAAEFVARRDAMRQKVETDRVTQRQAAEESRARRLVQIEERNRKRPLWLPLEGNAVAEDDALATWKPDGVRRGVRRWVAKPDGFRMDAILDSIAGDRVVLKMRDGDVDKWPVADLSDDDRMYLKSLEQAQTRSAARLAERDRRQKSDGVALEESRQKLKRIADALVRQRDALRVYPAPWSFDGPSKKQMLSWRVLLLPQLGEQALFEKFHLDEPWFSEHNRSLIASMPEIYRIPGSQPGPGRTSYLMVSEAIEVAIGRTYVPDDDIEGVVNGVRPQMISDGMAQTIMLVEGSDDLAVTWTRPVDFPGPAAPNYLDLHGTRSEGFLCAMFDGAVRQISRKAAENDVRALFTISGREPVDLDAMSIAAPR